MSELTQEQVTAFLAGLDKLTKETGVELSSCGCCDTSTTLRALRTSGSDYGYMIDPPDGYTKGSWSALSWERISADMLRPQPESKPNALRIRAESVAKKREAKWLELRRLYVGKYVGKEE